MTRFDLPTGGSIDVEPGAPNVDAIDRPIRLWAAIHFHPVKVARAMFPDRPVGYVRATQTIGCYAANKEAAIDCRLRGDIRAALVYETHCDMAYERLPSFARW